MASSVQLAISNPDQISLLEWLLTEKKIEYTVVPNRRKSLGDPYLIVDGVPLDIMRAIKWINE